ncbi:chondroitin AC/alginate lyase [Sphaerosporella brunnea]|uniref:Chondroitin AC/alginate lyase n=1 Tax=Sphaerosporella brunnea TaxID=1250544 RepID=A0A5J5ETC5_9PEZI|nr:chondroitin AC/alginate lyase [Sphaerosporella brunnea]
MRFPVYFLLAYALSLSAPAAAFVHPGLLHTAADFARVRNKVNAQAEPWLTGFQKLTSNSHSAITYRARPQATVYRGLGSPENYSILYNDLAAAYALCLRWKITGDTTFADAAAAIINGWSSTLKTIGGTSDRFLAAGLYGYQFANAVEMLRTYAGWSSGDFAAAKSLLLNVFYPMNHDFLVNHNGARIDHYWSNWDLCNMCSALSIGVATDNATIFNEAIDYFYVGAGNGAINHTVWKLYPAEGLGQLQEAGRDQGHTTLSVGLLVAFAQMAYNQNVDLFAHDDNRILKGAEYAAKYNLGYDVPYTTYKNCDVTQTVVSNNSRGDMRPIWELPYNHYVKIKGLRAEFTAAYAEKVRSAGGGAEGGGGDYGPNSGGYDQLGYGTLMYSVQSHH